MWETFGSTMKLILPWTALSISLTSEFGERKIPILPYHHPWITQSHCLGLRFLERTHRAIFRYQTITAALYMDICGNKTLPWRTLGIARGSWKMAPVHIEQLKSFISLTNISMILPFALIITSIRAATWIGFPYSPNLTPCDFYLRVIERWSVAPKSANNSRSETVQCATFSAVMLERLSMNLFWDCPMLYWKY